MSSPPPLSGPALAPASGGKPKQLFVFLHGFGASGDDLIGLAPIFAQAFPDAQFLSPHAPFPCRMAGAGYQWFGLQSFSPAEMLQGARQAAPILDHYLSEQLAAHGLSDDKLVLIGFSQGTMMALHAALRRDKPCAGVIGFSGALVGAETLAREITSRPPVCLIHGAADMVVPYAAMPHAASVLTALGVTVETHTRPMLGHGIDDEGLEHAMEFAKSQVA